MSKKTVRLLIAGIMTTLLMFSQIVLAGYACQRMNNVGSMSSMSDMHDCMTKKATLSVTCSAHCEKNAQISSSSTNLPTPSFSLVAWMQPLPTLMSVITTDTTVSTAVDPPLISPTTPLRLQYQVFRI